MADFLLKKRIIQEAKQALEAAGIENALYEINLLLCWVTKSDRLSLLKKNILLQEEKRQFDNALKRRLKREPMAFIIGEQGFWSLDFYVSNESLIPRPDSEALIELILEHYPDRSFFKECLDLGTGTGCLLLSILKEYPKAFGIGVDIALGAVELAKCNAKRNFLEERASFMVGSWGEALKGTFDLIISNPPYIKRNVLEDLMPEVLSYEPHRALDGGEDGLDDYRCICKRLPQLLRKGGCAIFELGIGQEDDVVAIAQQYGLKKRASKRDYNGIIRALLLELD